MRQGRVGRGGGPEVKTLAALVYLWAGTSQADGATKVHFAPWNSADETFDVDHRHRLFNLLPKDRADDWLRILYKCCEVSPATNWPVNSPLPPASFAAHEFGGEFALSDEAGTQWAAVPIAPTHVHLLTCPALRRRVLAAFATESKLLPPEKMELCCYLLRACSAGFKRSSEKLDSLHAWLKPPKMAASDPSPGHKASAPSSAKRSRDDWRETACKLIAEDHRLGCIQYSGGPQAITLTLAERPPSWPQRGELKKELLPERERLPRQTRPVRPVPVPVAVPVSQRRGFLGFPSFAY